jgi:putative peptidoglycan lipid II flippase
VAVIALPAAVGMFMLAGPMLATLFQYGEFTAADTRMASLSLMAYSVALVGFTLVKVLSPGYFSRQDIRTPVRVSIRAMFVNIVLNVAIVVPMILLAIPGAHAGLAAATGLAAIYNASALYRGLRASGFTCLPAAGGRLLFACCWRTSPWRRRCGSSPGRSKAGWRPPGMRAASAAGGCIVLGLASISPRCLRSACGPGPASQPARRA